MSAACSAPNSFLDNVIDSIHAAINHRHVAADRRRTHATDVNMTRPDVCVCLIFHGLSRWDEAANDQGRREDEAQGGGNICVGVKL